MACILKYEPYIFCEIGIVDNQKLTKTKKIAVLDFEQTVNNAVKFA